MHQPAANTPSTTTPDFSGLWVPIVTPFLDNQDRDVDHAALARLAHHLQQQGIAGLVVCGSTGEAAALSADEQRAVLDTVLEATPGLRVVMGVSDYHLPDVLARVQLLGTLPLAGLLVSAPHYIRPAQQGLLHWFGQIADSSPHPLIVYDIPYRTGVQIHRDTLLRLATHPNIAALKDCGGDAGKTLALIAQGELQVLAGEDLQIFSTVAQGGVGAIAACAHVATRRFAEVIALLRAGQLEAARALWMPLAPLIEALFAEPNPAPVKALLAHEGLLGATLRAPMTGCTPPHAAALVRLLGAL